MKKIEQLEAYSKRLRHKAREIENEIEKIQFKKIKPDLIKRYKGKYFKSINFCNPDDKWFIYHFIKDILSERQIIEDSFQIKSGGSTEINTDITTYMSMSLIEVTKDEFFENLEKVKTILTNIAVR